MAEKAFYYAPKISTEVCTGAIQCIQICLTGALPVLNIKTRFSPERYTDCKKYLQIGPADTTINKKNDLSTILKYRARVAFVPNVLIVQFPRSNSARKTHLGITERGFTHAHKSGHGVSILIEKINEYVAGHTKVKPVISSFCSAIVRLIQIRFQHFTNTITLLMTLFILAAISFKTNYNRSI